MLDKLPKRLWAKVRKELRQASLAPTRQDCRDRLERLATGLRKAGQADAAATVIRDIDDFLTFYDFPQEHWVHRRTTDPIESIFGGVRLRTDVTRQLPNRENGLYLVYKVIQRLGQHWRRITGSNLCKLVLDGRQFVDGQMVDTAVK